MSILNKLFGPKVDFDDMIARGAVIIDVRSPQEFASGNIPTSKNIPLQSLASKMKTLDKNVPIITCCASGMRSGAAKSQLKAAGFKEVENGGGWNSLLRKLM